MFLDAEQTLDVNADEASCRHFLFQTPSIAATRSATGSFTFVKVSSRPEIRHLYTSGSGKPSLIWTRLAPAGTMVPWKPPMFVQPSWAPPLVLTVSVHTVPAGTP